ncbi:DUF2621 family protein [Aneurinibacillus aneurinilyticus]|jgi:glutamate mutase epsilon subunit|uniref:DUF2621 family protein n=2 Tax=Aneurinibacillus aneurinilyticus TaxID=1391 RepID=A0A848CSH8_ANEAE|nr:DUF2621 family protein [Aneurinibacillus aneurinilyticus]ERI07937.1 hypothetical protein HMPREF0083_03945 [Aneurinibacillus aneurinilyticus ATCC 12856]MCI1694324.1 DUF2621 domain-containing protein [Aneurinibacillus aneurinilyticus]MED0670132.1 DUF2621 family protein [Aneurinibacillus aneurinilyticus]MED0705423.1 DUF2621 family protein [Aneurinibacillus aneurinilyticus]MED0724958.1 DUF2621 family protein [Aneurinibacillus aneurinilyticus]
MSAWFGSFIIVWTVLLILLLAVGGFFMFRKFLKSMPKQDGMSELDWQDHYIDKTRHMWTDETTELLDELVSPVPQLFRDVARRSIAGKIGMLALEAGVKQITTDLVIKGYIVATPARDHKFLVAHLQKKQIDFSPYKQHLKINV